MLFMLLANGSRSRTHGHTHSTFFRSNDETEILF